MGTITDISVKDIRFPTSLDYHGSDAVHKDPDYSAAYVVIKTDRKDVTNQGYGMAFTLGRGTEIVVLAIQALSPYIIGTSLCEIFNNFGVFWRSLINESQLRWLGPEKGVVHLAVAAIVNGIWDLWARIENKPLWKLLVDMEPEKLLSTLDLHYLQEVMTRDEALEILTRNCASKNKREELISEQGYPAYITSVGWLGYSNNKIKELCKTALDEGWKKFKMKVGVDINNDMERASTIRSMIGWDKDLMMDANQVWSVDQAITHMKKLSKYKPKFIEEPTHPDDILGHAKVTEGLKHEGIAVATGETCPNRVIFKQFLQANGLQYCQIDSCRLGGVNEVIIVLLLAAKFNVPVWPHAGGVGLCEMVQHLSIFDYIAISPSLENKATEYCDHLHEHFVSPCIVKNGAYVLPMSAGYSTEMVENSLSTYEYPNGTYWSNKHDFTTKTTDPLTLFKKRKLHNRDV